MKPKRLLWQLFPSYILISLICLAAIGWYAISSMQQFYYDQVAGDLEASAHIIEDQIKRSFNAGSWSDLDGLCKMLGKAGHRRITVIRSSGQVLADSQEQPKQMDDHSDRPEIIEAKLNEMGSAIRFSNTLGVNMMYVAIPLADQGKIVAVLRIARPLSAIDEQLRTIYNEVLIAGIVVAAVAVVLSLAISRKISRPLEELKAGAELFAEGHLTHKLSTGDSKEVNAVAKAMNQMAGEINERICTISRQRNEHKAVLSSMAEAVLAVDSQQKLITLNSSAAEMMDVDISTAKGRALQEVVRNPALQRFVINSLASDGEVEDNITLQKDGMESFLQVRSSVLKDAQGQKIGTLVVLNDITRIRRLENIRSDFVANVSHELKTPITSIKGFVETLLDGGVKDPEEINRFLEIIARQSNRMNNIIDDLLALSGIEQQSEKVTIELARSSVRKMLAAAVELCEHKAQAKQIQIDLSCGDDIFADINTPLLEQAVVNLLDNAIKYSNDSGKVELAAEKAGDNINIAVTDFGCGIDKESQTRLFERFFRVDKARSRKLGGTGLGLSIVKHIVQVHGGSISVESSPGSGSTFTIQLLAS